jgi:hypothetical protein
MVNADWSTVELAELSPGEISLSGTLLAEREDQKTKFQFSSFHLENPKMTNFHSFKHKKSQL